MFVTKRKHEALMAEKDAAVDRLQRQLSAATESAKVIINDLLDQRDRAAGELEQFRSARAKANANLIPGGRRKTA